METLIQDIRYAVRTLAKTPGFTLIALLTLALGIGANTAIFSILDGVMLKLPFKDAEHLAVVTAYYPDAGDTPTSYPDFVQWRERNAVFSTLVAEFNNNFNYVGKRDPERLFGSLISEGYFQLLDIKPKLGRLPSAEEHRKGATPVCLISDALWKREFNSDSRAPGQAITLSGLTYTIVGVMPPGVPEIDSTNPADIWVPLEARPRWEAHGFNYLRVLGKLKPGVTAQRAKADIEVIQSGIDAQFPANKHAVHVTALPDFLVGNTRPILFVLLGAVGFVLLIACANVANLLLARATGRSREFAIREALGAGRPRLIRQLLTESLLLALTAGLCGVLMSQWAVRAMLHFWPENLRRPEQVSLDPRVLAFTTGVLVLAAVVFGLAPALLASRTNVNTHLKESGRGASDSRGHKRLRSVFVVSEIALATVLLVGATLMLRSLSRLQRTDPGFDAHGLLALRIPLPSSRYAKPEQQSQFFEKLLAATRNLPGVKSVAATSYLPFADGVTADFKVEGVTFPSDHAPFAEVHVISPDYFSTMSIPLIKGRWFSDQDRTTTAKVLVINRTMAEKIWPGQDAIGKRVDIGFSEKPEWAEVVGVVGNIKADALDTPPAMQVYASYQQLPMMTMSLLVRSAGDPASLIEPVKHAVAGIDSQQPVSESIMMDELISLSVARPRSSTFLLAVFAGLAMLMASIGIYGVMAYSIAQRVHEIGIRMALGARSGEILRMVLVSGMRLTMIGAGAGTITALILARFMRTLLFGITGTDPITFAVAGLALGGTALLASYLPARRAAKVDPMVALHYE